MTDDDTRDLDADMLGSDPVTVEASGLDQAARDEETAPGPSEATALDFAAVMARLPPPTVAPPAALAPQPRPRTRWAGVAWGLVFAALAAGGLRLAAGPRAIEEIGAWVQQVEPATLIAYGLLTVGGLVLVTGLVGLARRAQKRLARPHG